MSLNLQEKKKSPPRGVEGGDFEAMGCILFDLVCVCGLQPTHSVVELDCGSGRLTVQLGQYLQGSYLGMDGDATARGRARQLTANHPEWRFEAPVGFAIPAANSSVDMIFCFGPFTRLLHEECYLYLEEFHRALKPGGKVILSFLEFDVPPHWAVFEGMISRRRGASKAQFTLQFLSRDGLYAWADAAGLVISDLWSGDPPFVPLAAPVQMQDGRIFEREGSPGQSVCVMQKPLT